MNSILDGRAADPNKTVRLPGDGKLSLLTFCRTRKAYRTLAEAEAVPRRGRRFASRCERCGRWHLARK